MTTDRDATEAIALTAEEFWALVESVPDDPAIAEFERLSAELSERGENAVAGFHAALTLALFDLDGRANHAWFVANDPAGLGFVSEDVFLYARCATVLAGREIWERSCANQTLEWRDSTLHESGISEMLLEVAPQAAELLGIEDWWDLSFRLVPLSYETGSNAARWD